jgi:hypothetical protein
VTRSRAIFLAIAAAIVAAIVLGWALSRETPEARVRAQLARLARAVRVDPQESPLARRARIGGEFEEVLTKEIAFDVPEITQQGSGRGALADAATAAASIWVSAEVDLTEVAITIAPSNASATAIATATLVGTRRDGGGTERDRRDVTFELRVESGDGEWRVSAIHVSARQQ